MSRELLNKYKSKENIIKTSVFEKNKEKFLREAREKFEDMIINFESDFLKSGNLKDYIDMPLHKFLLDDTDFQNYNIKKCTSLEWNINEKLIDMYFSLLKKNGYYCSIYGTRNIRIYKSKKSKFEHESNIKEIITIIIFFAIFYYLIISMLNLIKDIIR